MKRSWLGLALLAGLIGVVGCGPSYNKVEGVVQYENGTPVEGATVVFVPADGTGMSPSGYTDAKGSFTLKTGNTEGVKKGKYKVLITKLPKPASGPMEAGTPDAMKAMQKYAAKKQGPLVPGAAGKSPEPGGENELDRTYASAEKTPFTAEIPPSAPLNFKVKAKKGK